MNRKIAGVALFALAIPGTAFAVINVQTLASFTLGTTGNGAGKLTFDASGNLYGTNNIGGSGGGGTLFELPAGSHTISAITSFQQVQSQSIGPISPPLIDPSGNFFGTTQEGGTGTHFPGGDGTIYEVTAGVHNLLTLDNFTGTNGVIGSSSLTFDAAGNMYGTTEYGGDPSTYDFIGAGTVYKLAANTHAFSTIVQFNQTNGLLPMGGVITDKSGNLYGTTSEGGNLSLGGGSGCGVVYKINGTTHAETVLAAFNNNNGNIPSGNLVMNAAGDLFGTTSAGGDLTQSNTYGDGVVFEIPHGTNTIQTLIAFNANTGKSTPNLIIDAAGNLFGLTSGATNGYGILYEIPAGTSTFNTLRNFDSTTSVTNLVADSAGNLYGGGHSTSTGTYGGILELTGTGYVAYIPEPTAVCALPLAGLVLLARRRKSAIQLQ